MSMTLSLLTENRCFGSPAHCHPFHPGPIVWFLVNVWEFTPLSPGCEALIVAACPVWAMVIRQSAPGDDNGMANMLREARWLLELSTDMSNSFEGSQHMICSCHLSLVLKAVLRRCMSEDIHIKTTLSCLTIKSRRIRFVSGAIHPSIFRIIHLCYSGEAIPLGRKKLDSGSAWGKTFTWNQQ